MTLTRSRSVAFAFVPKPRLRPVQSWFQPAIDRYYTLLAGQANKPTDLRIPIIYQTYQTYRHDARERMHAMWRAVSERLAAERDVRAIMAIGIAEIDRVFAQLADDVERGALVEDDATPEEAAIEAAVAEQLIGE